MLRRPLHRPLGRPATIRHQLIAIVLIPSISLIVVALGVTAQLALDANRTNTLQQSVYRASQQAGDLVTALQQERRRSMLELAAGSSEGRAQLEVVRGQVNAAMAGLSTDIEPLVSGSASTEVRAQLGALGGRSEELRQLRSGIDAGQIDLATAYTAYSQTIAGFGASLRIATQEASDQRSTYDQLTSVDIFYGSEAFWRSVSLTEVALLGEELPQPLADDLSAQAGAYLGRFEALAAILTRSERTDLLTAADGASQQRITQSQTLVSRRLVRSGTVPRNWPEVNESEWSSAVSDVAAQITALYDRHARTAAERSDASATADRNRALLIGAVLVLAGIAVSLVAVRMSGRLAGRLLALRDDTRDLTEGELPETIAWLKRGEPGAEARTVRPLEHGEDEIGQVAQAFNEAQAMAVQAAVDEAAARNGTRQAFLTIARRAQNIAYGQLKLLDQAQDLQDDPKHLEILFQLDHLATRSRRHAENLVILAGQQPGRRWSAPVPLMDVVRGASSEALDYESVQIGSLPAVSVAAEQVADVIHILAELIDNAGAVGPAHSPVLVRGGVAGSGVVLEVADHGVGMSDQMLAELNRKLSEGTDFGELALSGQPRLGLFVVARLAAKHGIKVTLTASRVQEGTVAVVLLPVHTLAGARELTQVPGARSLDTGPFPGPARR